MSAHRLLSLLVLLPAVLLSACSTTPTQTPARYTDTSTLKVHPGLLGRPVPAELQDHSSPEVKTVMADGTGETRRELKSDALGIRTQRSVYFELNSDEVRDEFKPMLKAHADYLAAHPGAKLRVEGNADERGSVDYNRRLGLKRAESVKDALLVSGAKSAQIKSVSLGESKPKLAGHDEESWAENRRADIIYDREE
jgi:peptidoglycan-associated lipoprotein